MTCPPPGQRRFSQSIDFSPCDADDPSIRTVDSSNQIEEGGFPGTGGTLECKEIPLIYLEGDVLEHRDLQAISAIRFGNLFDLDH
jgi:hypothetical protein